MSEIDEYSSEFQTRNDELIREIEDEQVKEYLTSLRKFYSENNDEKIFEYAEVQLGLAKAMDFIQPNVLNNTNVQNLVNNVTLSAYQLFHYKINQCSDQKHEDGACLVGGINYAILGKQLPETQTIWPELPIADALNFTGIILPYIIPVDTSIFRIIGENDENLARGHWWLEQKPRDRKNWRANSSVSKQWNKGTFCAEFKKNTEIRVWKGIASAQAVPRSPIRCFLPGGEYQVWLSIDNFTNVSFDIQNWPGP